MKEGIPQYSPEEAQEEASRMKELVDKGEAKDYSAAERKIEREKVMVVEVDNPLPLHLLCLQYGLSYNTADRIYAINKQLKNPNFVSGEMSIYVQ